MVIRRTSATEVSIQAVSPELGVQSVRVLASQAGGVAGASVVAAGAVCWLWARAVSTATLLETISSKAQRKATNRAHLTKVIIPLLSLIPVGYQSAAASVSPVRMRTACSSP